MLCHNDNHFVRKPKLISFLNCQSLQNLLKNEKNMSNSNGKALTSYVYLTTCLERPPWRAVALDRFHYICFIRAIASQSPKYSSATAPANESSCRTRQSSHNKYGTNIPINTVLSARIGPVLGRGGQQRTSTGPVLTQFWHLKQYLLGWPSLGLNPNKVE